MPQKPDPHFGALPTSCKRIPCDFGGMRGVRAQPVTIRYVPLSDGRGQPGYSWRTIRELSRDVPRKSLIRSFSRESMRGVSGKNAIRTGNSRRIRDLKRRRSLIVRSTQTQLAACFRRVASDLILLYLTLVAIFDNRHGLLKKIEVGERRNPCRP